MRVETSGALSGFVSSSARRSLTSLSRPRGGVSSPTRVRIVVDAHPVPDEPEVSWVGALSWGGGSCGSNVTPPRPGPKQPDSREEGTGHRSLELVALALEVLHARESSLSRCRPLQARRPRPRERRSELSRRGRDTGCVTSKSPRRAPQKGSSLSSPTTLRARSWVPSVEPVSSRHTLSATPFTDSRVFARVCTSFFTIMQTVVAPCHSQRTSYFQDPHDPLRPLVLREPGRTLGGSFARASSEHVASASESSSHGGPWTSGWVRRIITLRAPSFRSTRSEPCSACIL